MLLGPHPSSEKIPKGRAFFLSSLVASIILILGDQSSILIWSPSYFSNLGEFVWNLFASTSFLWLIATLYGFVGGVCWPILADLADPFGRLKTSLSLSRKDPSRDSSNTARLTAGLAAITFWLLATYILQLHFSTAYNNKPLAALIFVGLLMTLVLPGGFVVFTWSRIVFHWITRRLEPQFPRKLFLTELLLLVLLCLVSVVLTTYRNLDLLNLLDGRPLALIALFLVGQFPVYRFLASPSGRGMLEELSSGVSLAFWAMILLFSFFVSVVSFPSQPHVASILRHHTLLSREIILLAQQISDRDRDGFSSILLGGDCNDSDNRIHPMASEIPGNGIDDDCQNGDAALRPIVTRQKGEEERLRIESIQKKFHVLIISVDALRADHCSFLGHSRPTTPELDELAKSSFVFSRAYAPAPTTAQSLPAMITSYYPSQIKWENYHAFPRLADSNETALTRLKQSGYRIAGIFSYWYFEYRQLERGADFWDTSVYRKRGHPENVPTDDLLTDNVIEYIRQVESGSDPLFLWVHYFDPHFLYLPHAAYPFGDQPIDLYDGEIRFTSAQIGRLLERLKSSPLWDNLVIVVIGDHGEEFEEHGRLYHGSQLFEESVHVPLLIRVPNLTPSRLDTPVSLIDIVPTLYDLTGVKGDSQRIQGESLLPMMLGFNSVHEPIYLEKLRTPTFFWSAQALLIDPWKIIYFPDEQTYQLYNLNSDPKEQHDLFTMLPEKAAEMRLRLNDFRERRLTHDGGWYRMSLNSP